MVSVDLVTPVQFASTGAALLHVSPGDPVFYSIVPEDITARSRVLSCIAEAGGEAHLPPAVSNADFRTWMTACQADEAKRQSIDIQTLCTVLKVPIFLNMQA